MNVITPPAKGAAPFGRFEWMVARRYLGATRKGGGVSLISIIAFLGIALSVATVLVVMSVFQGFRINLLNQLLSVNGHVFVGSQAADGFQDYDEVADLLRSVDGVERATPLLRVDAYAVGPGGQTGLRIHGIDKANLLAIEEVAGPDHIFRGGYDTFGEGRFGGNEIALGDGLAYELGVWPGDVISVITGGGAETVMGEIPITRKEYKVAAIFDIGNAALDAFYAYMPLEQAQLFGRRKGQVSEIELRVEDAVNIDPVVDEVQRVLSPPLVMADWRDRNRDYFGALEVERGLQRILMLMIVGVATLLIISGLVMLVKDKRGDIAIMRTMGATKGSIMRIFLLVGAVIGVSGAVVGVLLAILIVNNLGPIERFLSWSFGYEVFPAAVYFLEEIPAIFEWSEVAIVLTFTLTMSFIWSAYPAWRASKLDPVEALRYE